MKMVNGFFLFCHNLWMNFVKKLSRWYSKFHMTQTGLYLMYRTCVTKCLVLQYKLNRFS